MRNQIAAAQRLGIRAHTINSTNRDEWEEVQRLLAEDAVDLLLISPERLNNPQFRDEMLPLFVERGRAAGHRRGALHLGLGSRLPPRLPPRWRTCSSALPADVAVLCTTATANDRVVADVARAARGGHAGELRDLPRTARRATSLRLEVVELPGRPSGSRGWSTGCRSWRARGSSTR